MNIDRRTLPLTALRAFEAFGRLGSMTLAAEALGVTHSAISRQIKELEAVLGVPLVQGPRTRTRLSVAGKTILPGLTEGFDGLENALNRLPRAAETVDVSCPSTLAMRWLIPRLFGFQTMNPGVKVRLTSDDGPVDQGPDIAIRVGAGPWPKDREMAILFGDRMGPVLAPALMPSYDEEVLSLSRLSTATRPGAWSDWTKAEGVTLQPAKETVFEHFHFLIEGALAGLGAAVVPELLVASELATGRLVAPFGFRNSGMDYVALTRKPDHKAARLFRDWLLREAGRET